jgi:hypothetical protein
LVGVQPETGLHAGELGVEQRLAVGGPVLHAFCVRGLLIILRGRSSQCKA